MSAKFFLFPFQVISTLVIILLAEKTVIKTYAIKYSFLNSRQFYADLQPAESRYKVAAKPVPYKPPKPAPSHLEGVTPTLPVVTKPQEFFEQNRNEFAPTVSLAPAVSKPRSKPGSTRDDTSFNSKFKTNKNQGLSKVSLKDFLENKKKKKQLRDEEREILEQVKSQHKKTSPKTKYETDTVIYPTTTYRPQTFHSSDIAKQLGIAPYSGKQQNGNLREGKKKNNKSNNSVRTLSANRPSTYVEAANYKPELAYGTRKNKGKKKEKSGRRLRLKKVRRKKKFKNKSQNKPQISYKNKPTSGSKGNNREEKSFLLKQKQIKKKYENRWKNDRKKSKAKESERLSKKLKEEKNRKSKKNTINKSKYNKDIKLKSSKRDKQETEKNSFKDTKFSSSLFLEDSTGDRGSLKSIRRATKPPKYHGYENAAIPISNYAAPADHYGGVSAYNALLSEFAPLEEDYLDGPPVTPITPNIGNHFSKFLPLCSQN